MENRNKIYAKKIKNYSISILEKDGFVKTNTYLSFKENDYGIDK